MGIVLHLEWTVAAIPRESFSSNRLVCGLFKSDPQLQDQVPQNVESQEVLNNVLADQPALLADNKPIDHNRGNQPVVDAVVSAHLIFICLVPIFYHVQTIHQRL